MLIPNSAPPGGIVFNIQPFSIHDGPGIRDVIFFKGCTLHCPWCSNPESITPRPELCYKQGRCLGTKQCGLCLKACPHGAIGTDGHEPQWLHARCQSCGACEAACPAKAVVMMGRTTSVEELCTTVHANDVIFRNSEGGVTLSGGEPIAQPAFAHELLSTLGADGIHRAVETAGNVPWNSLAPICEVMDLLIYDVKHLDAIVHESHTGCSNALILENLRRVTKDFPHLPIWVRTPVIPSFNDNEDTIAAIANFVASLPSVQKYELLPFHNYGEQKYKQLGRPYAYAKVPALKQERLKHLKNLISAPFAK